MIDIKKESENRKRYDMIKIESLPPCIILCGGEGTRLRDVTELLPKPMVPVGQQPIVWHIMKTYAAYGVKRFILCLGYKREAFIDYFLNYHERSTDITIKLGKEKKILYHSFHGEEDWEVSLVDTGNKTQTGGRLHKGVKYLQDHDENFFFTYGDAVANVNIKNLFDFHKQENKEITVTAVHPAGRFGAMRMDGNNVIGFHEKPQTEQGLINGGFMVLKKSFIARFMNDDPQLIFEQEPMGYAVKENQMSSYIHNGFWQCMDTQREHQLLNNYWDSGKASWKVW